MAKLKHTTTQDIPQESTTNIHNYAPNYAAVMIVGSIVLLLLLWLGQRWAINLLATLHFADPQATMAMLLLLLVFGLPLGWLLNRLVHGWAAARHNRYMDRQEMELERLQLMYRLQQSVVADSRELDPHTKRRNALITALITDGLQGRHNFSYRKAGEYTLTNESKPLGKDSKVVSDALGWLRDRGKVRDNKLVGYTSLGQLQRDLHAPILLSSGRDDDDDSRKTGEKS